MQAIVAIVLWNLVGFAFEREFSICDAVRITAYSGAEVSLVVHISVDIFVAKHYIGDAAGTVGSVHRNQRGAKRNDISLDPILVLKHIQVDCRAFRRLAKCALLDCALALRVADRLI